jgi:hypothetical protein
LSRVNSKPVVDKFSFIKPGDNVVTGIRAMASSLASYRACLEKYEQAPARAREYCGQYGKALQDIGLQIKEPIDTDPRTKDTTRTPPKPK